MSLLTRKEITMSCKSAIYTVNNSGTTVTTTAGTFVQVPFGSIVRRFGDSIKLDGDSILCCNSGYFDVEISMSLTPTAAGTVTIQLYQDGVAVPGALSTITVPAVATTETFPITALIRNCGCNCGSVLTVRINASATINNFATVVEKL